MKKEILFLVIHDTGQTKLRSIVNALDFAKFLRSHTNEIKIEVHLLVDDIDQGIIETF